MIVDQCVVYAVEASDMAEQARGVIKANGMSEQIDVMQCLVEVAMSNIISREG